MLAVDLADHHQLRQQEMFVPITIVARVRNLEEAIRRANEVTYGLTPGFYGAPDEVEWLFDRIEAEVAYANRPQGSTAGATSTELENRPYVSWPTTSVGVYCTNLFLHGQKIKAGR
ncbi:MAG TPA: aldehyde dehydrogenase family protein [Syntrophobacteria bacterium]|nr:aldehyde dehydrogenase family protein [Syntrophobacteria bacterium]